jgi:transcriptional regulator with XRE-family HTH domain
MMTGRRTHEFTIGDRLRKAREVAGFDQRAFEAASGISRATIGAYELGKSTPKRAYLSIWANVTDTDVDWLLHGDEIVRSPEHKAQLNDDERDVTIGSEDGQEASTSSVSNAEGDRSLPCKGPRAGWGSLA